MLKRILKFGLMASIILAVAGLVSTNSNYSAKPVAQAGDITIGDWVLSDTALNATNVTYNLTFVAATAIPKNGRAEIMFRNNSGRFDALPDFRNVSLGSNGSFPTNGGNLQIFPAGQGMIAVISNSGDTAVEIPAGTLGVKVELKGVNNPSQGGEVSTEVTTFNGSTKLDNSSLAENITFGTVSMSGKVSDKTSGSGIEGVRVELHGPSGFFQSSTDSSGNYAFLGVTAGQYTFEMSPGVDPRSSSASTVSQYLRPEPEQVTIGTTLLTKNLSLSKSSKTITGTVKYVDTKAAVVGANVSAFSMGGGGFANAQTGSDGSFTLRVSKGDYFVQVEPAFNFGPPPGDQGQQPPQGQQQPQALLDRILGSGIAVAQQAQAASDFFPRPPVQVGFFKDAAETEAINLGELLVDRADATVTGKLVKSDGSAFSGGGGMGVENFRQHLHIPIQVQSNGTFTFKAKKNSGTWELHMFDPQAAYTLPDTSFEIDSATKDLGTIKLLALDKTITVTAKRIDKGNENKAIANMPFMAFNERKPGPPYMGFTNSEGVATIKVPDGFEGRVMGMPGGQGGPGQRDGGGPQPSKEGSKTGLNSFVMQAYAQESKSPASSGPSINNDASRLFPVTPAQKVKAGGSITMQYDLADKKVSVRTVDSTGTLVNPGAFVEARPKGTGFKGFGGGFGGPTAGGSGSVYTTTGDFEFNTFFPPDTDYIGQSKSVTVSGDMSVDLVVKRKTVNITGEVRDASNNNAVIKDASLEIMIGLFGENGMSMGNYNPSTGTYTAKWAPDMKVRVGVAAGDPGRGIAKGGYIPNISPTELSGKDGETITHHITLAKVDATISGAVKDQDGKAVAGVSVTADPGLADILEAAGDIGPGPGGPGGPGPDNGPEFGFTGLTDADGKYAINVTPGQYAMIVGAREKGLFQNKTVEVTIKSGETKSDVNLNVEKATSTVNFTAISTSTTAAVVTKPIIHIFSDDGRTNVELEADDAGKVTFKLPAGTYSFEAGKDSPEESKSYGSDVKKFTVAANSASDIALPMTEKTAKIAMPSTTEVSSSSTTIVSLNYQGSAQASVQVPAGAISSSSSSSESSSSDSSPLVTATVRDEEAPRTKTDTPIAKTGLTVSAVDTSGNVVTSLNAVAQMEMHYDEKDLPPGVKEANLVAKVYNESTGQYESTQTSVVDTTNNVVRFTTNHFSDFAVVATTDTAAPAAPTSITATDTTVGGEIKLTWTNPSDSDLANVNIYRSTTSGTQGDKVKSTSAKTDTSFTDTGLTNSTKYYYTIKAVDTSGNESTNTTQVSATPTKAATTATLPKTGSENGVNPLIAGLLALFAGSLVIASIRRFKKI